MAMKLGILVSGRGSNLEAVLDAVAAGELAGVEPVLVVSNRPGVRALEVAARHGVPARAMPLGAFGGDAEARDAAIGVALVEARVELALLAGYDRVLRSSYFAAFTGRTINIHPSLLPLHGGPGMLGESVHAAVLVAGERETGATIHEVTQDLDAGPILAQERVVVDPGDDTTRLAARVLEVEHRLLVSTLGRLAGVGVPGMRSATMTAAVRERRQTTTGDAQD
jgi:phosphoribosylglycinamide formyltransferase-1